MSDLRTMKEPDQVENMNIVVTGQSPLNEEDVIKRVVAGEKDLFIHLVNAYQDKIYTMVMRQVGNETIAEEMTQEAFIRAYRALAKFRFASSFSTWLTRIAINQSKAYFNSKRFRETKKTIPLDAEKHKASETPNEDPLASEELLQKLRHAVAALKPRYRDVLLLCSFENKTYKETAEILEIPFGTVCSRMNKAIHLLRAEMGRDEL